MAVTRHGMCVAAAPSCTAHRHAKAPAAPTCTTPCWSSCSRCCSRPRWRPPHTRWPTPSNATASKWPPLRKRSNGPASRPAGRCANTTRSNQATGWSPAPWRPRLEDRLAALHHAEADLAAARARHPVRLTSDELAWLKRVGADVRAVFGAPATSNSQRKQLICAVISEIVLTIDRQKRTCDALIVWQGAATTTVTIALPKIGGGAITTSEDTLALVRRLAGHYNDTTIAQILGRQHRRTATGLAWTRERVSSLRRSNNIPHCPVPTGNVSASGQDAIMASVPQTAQLLGVDKTTIYRWLRDGFITGEQPTPGAPWRIRIDQALRDRIQPDVPDGWLPLDQAAKVLGIARLTVLQKVHHGQLNAVHVTAGRRKGLRIQVQHDQPGLFDTPR